MAQPLGNLLIESRENQIKAQRSLGDFAAFDDTIMFALMSNMSPRCLATLSQVSRALYCYAYHDEFWRNFCCIQHCKDNLPVKWCGSSWRETFIHSKNLDSQEYRYYSEDYRKSSPIEIRHVYSDLLHQTRMYATFDTKQFYTHPDNIDRRSGLSTLEFDECFGKPGKPVVLTDIVPNWKLDWSKESLLSSYGDLVFRAETIECTMKDYFKYADQKVLEETRLYLFDKEFPKSNVQVQQAFNNVQTSFLKNDYFALLEEDRPDYQWIIIGPERSGSSFHIDPNGTSAWNATILGSKKWILFPPGQVPPGVFPSADNAEVTTPNSLMEWFDKFYRFCHSGPAPKPVECITRPGDLLYVPSGWWHSVVNLEPCNVALTCNFVNRHNLLHVLKFIKDPNQVSGVAACNTLSTRFEQAVEMNHPGLIAELRNEQLQKSRNTSKRAKFWEATAEEAEEEAMFDFV